MAKQNTTQLHEELFLRISTTAHTENFYRELCEYVVGDCDLLTNIDGRYAAAFYKEERIDYQNNPYRDLCDERPDDVCNVTYARVGDVKTDMEIFLRRLPTEKEWEVLNRRIHAFFPFKNRRIKRKKIVALTIVKKTVVTIITEQPAGAVFHVLPTKQERRKNKK